MRTKCISVKQLSRGNSCRKDKLTGILTNIIGCWFYVQGIVSLELVFEHNVVVLLFEDVYEKGRKRSIKSVMILLKFHCFNAECGENDLLQMGKCLKV